MRQLCLPIALLSTLVGCADVASEDDLGAATLELTDGSPQAVGILAFLNHPDATLSVLDEDVGLDRRAAENIIAHRDGADGTFGVDPFDDLAELDAVSWVGGQAIDRLLSYSLGQGFVPSGDDLLGVYDGVSFTVNEAALTLEAANTLDAQILDDELGLDTRASHSIIEARPVPSVKALAELYYVGATALTTLKTLARPELGVISDLDKTIIPPSTNGLPDAPYPGVAMLLTELETRNGGTAGDVHYVTARQPESVVDIPAWLAEHALPAGTIDTGISGIPSIAQAEKVKDISAWLEARPRQSFVFFGDTNHRDPDAYREVKELFPDQVAAVFVHNVKEIDPARTEGLFVFDDYTQVAAELFRLRMLDEDQARAVIFDAVADGIALTPAEIADLIDSNRPN